MRAIRLTIGILAMAVMAAAIPPRAANASDSFTIDARRSTAKFTIRKLAVAAIKATFSDISGTAVFSKDAPADCSLDLVIGVASLDSGKDKQDKTMKSADFFDVEKYPDMRFKSTKFRKLGDGKYEVTGDFHLHGVKKTVSAVFEPVREQAGGNQLSLKTVLTIKRSDFGIKKDIPAVSDKVKIELSLVAVKK